LKYEGWWELATPLGERLAGALRAQLGGGAMRRAVVVPMPSPMLRRRKGHHAPALAAAVAASLGARSCRPVRRLFGRPQAGRSRSDRPRATRRGWWLHPLARQWIAGETVILVDDVLTTGRSAALATRCLRAAGAGSVVLGVVAVSPDHWR